MPFHLLQVPVWNQLEDPYGNLGLDPYRTQDCGEEVAAEIAWYYLRAVVSAYQVRLEMPGHGDSGLTTGQDIAEWLRGRGIAASVIEVASTELRARARAEIFAGRPLAALGWYAGPNELHWITLRGSGDGQCGFNDSWGGLYRQLSWGWVAAHYGGQIVTTQHKPR